MEGRWSRRAAPTRTASRDDSTALVIFDRNPATGAITQRAGAAGCVTSDAQDTVCAPRRTALINPSGDRDQPGRGRRSTSSAATAVAVFDRDPSTGGLTQKPGHRGLPRRRRVARRLRASHRGTQRSSTLMMSPDGRHLYTGTRRRSASSGATRPPARSRRPPDTAGCVANERRPADAPSSHDLGSARQTALSPDGRSLYAPGDRATTRSSSWTATRSRARCARRTAAAGCVGAVARLHAGAAPGRPRTRSPSARTAGTSTCPSPAACSCSRAPADGSLAFQSCVNDRRHRRVQPRAATSASRLLQRRQPGRPDARRRRTSTTFPGIAIFNRDADGNLVAAGRAATVACRPQAPR